MSITMLQKLKKVALFSEGIFISGSVFSEKNDSSALCKLLSRNSNYAEILFKDRVLIYQLTQKFYNHYGPTGVIVNDSPDVFTVFKNITWTAFFLASDVSMACPSEVFTLNSKRLMVDTFRDNFSPNNIDAVITLPPREEYFEQRGLACLVPFQCYQKWNLRLINRYFEENQAAFQNITEQRITDENMLPNSIWPYSESDCHQDKRAYPEIDEKIDGSTKWKFDKILLEGKASPPRGYKFGVYRKGDKT